MRIGIAIPDTLGSNLRGAMQRTMTFGTVARACSIFGVSDIWLYREEPESPRRNNSRQLTKVLRYLDTPQYLRKDMFPRDPDLRYVGLLPPLRTPHHRLWIPLSEVKAGTCRVGLTGEPRDGGTVIDVGLDSPVTVKERLKKGIRVTVEITDVQRSDLFGRIIEDSRLSEYWGYEVHPPTSGLEQLLQGFRGSLRILTSKHGDEAPSVWDELLMAVKASDSIIVAFGGPRRGVHEIIGMKRGESQRIGEFILNTVPGQKTETVRIEEAVSLSLGLLNLLRHKL